MIELVERDSWDDLDPAERAVFGEWLREIVYNPTTGKMEQHLAEGHDLYLLLRSAWRKWTRKVRTSSSQTFQSIKDTPKLPDDEK